MMGTIVGMVLVNIGILLLIPILGVVFGFIADIIREMRTKEGNDLELIFFGGGIGIALSVILIVVSIILWGLWLIL